jgi:hypothetical protein
MDSLKNILNKIHQFEQDYDVNSLRFNGVRAWPLFRKAIWADFMKKNIVSGVSHKTEPKKESGLSNNKFIRRYQLLRRKKKLNTELKEAKNSLCLNSDILLYSSASYLTDNIDGKLYDRHIDPIKELVYPNSNKLVDQVNPINAKLKASSLRLDLLENLMGLEAQLGNMPNFKIEAESSLLDRFEELFSIDINRYSYRFNRILCISEYLKDILFNQNIRVVFLPCWYDDYSLGLIHACKSLNILTVDVQHGKQGKYHAMYTHFTRVPEAGYEILPDYFWNWGEEYAENIKCWMNNEAHKTIVVGNLWTALWKEQMFKDESPELKELSLKMNNYEKRLIVSLQPIIDTIPSWLKEAVQEMPNTFFSFRPHPKQKEDNELRSIVNSLGENVDWDLCSNAPLYPLLQLFECHLTPWSSVAYEAKLMGLKNGIIHRQGVEMYAEEIRNEVFTSVQSQDEFKSFITSVEQKPYEGMVCKLELIKSNIKNALWN